MNVLILGASGMLGSAMFRYLSTYPKLHVNGTLRSHSVPHYFSEAHRSRLLTGVDVLDQDALTSVLCRSKPDVVINCVGLIKQYSISTDPLTTLPLNAMLPHRLAKLCELVGARLILISTDCVFSGTGHLYKEADVSDATDLYGKSKYIGEIHDRPHVVTIRTSIIGHELNSRNSLVDWFLSQTGDVKGYSHAIFSGLPTVELSRVVAEYVLPNENLHGLYHVSSAPIDKFRLLELIAAEYSHPVRIIEDNLVKIDRSLNSELFSSVTGYRAPDWPALIKNMYEDFVKFQGDSNVR